MNSECKPVDLSKNPHTLAIAEKKGMKKMKHHHELCGRIDEAQRSNPRMCVMVRKDGSDMRFVSWDHCSETKEYTSTNFRCHSETHFKGVIPPSYFLYCMSRDKDGKSTMHINNMHTK